jgi:curved DNA-binding protein CbpA
MGKDAARGGIESRVPEMRPGIDLRSLPVGPREAFVVSQIDGAASESDLAMITGLEASEVATILERLADLEAIDLPGYQPKPTPASARPTPASGGPRDVPGLGHLSCLAAEDAIYDPFELDEACDLPRDWRKRVLDLFYAAPYLDHYETLGSSSTATRDALKAAYFEIVAFIHPDRYFAKSLGSFRAKLATIFQRVSAAHDVLTRQRSRAEYDVELRARQLLAGQRPTREPLADALAEAAAVGTPRSEVASRQTQPPAAAASGGTASPPRVSAATAREVTRRDPHEVPQATERSSAPQLKPTIPVTSPASNPAAPLRSAQPLRVSLRASGRPRTRAESSIPAPPPRRSPSTAIAIQEEARAQMRRFYEEQRRRREGSSASDAGRDPVERLLHLARDATAQDRALCATNILRMAASIAPERIDVADELKTAEAAAAPQISDQALRRAKELEASGDLAAAAAAYRRAGSGRAEGWIFHRAADLVLRANGDLREARDLVLRALELEPERAEYHQTLGQVYLDAGKPASAIKSLERAASLAPKDGKTTELLRRARDATRRGA